MRRNFLILLGARGFASVAGALAFILVGRASGVVEIGLLGAITSILNFAFVVADLGLATYVSKQRAVGNHSALVAALRLNLISSSLSGAIFLVALIAISFFLPVIPWILALLAPALALEKNTDTALGVAIADGSMRVVVLVNLARRITHLALVIAMLACHVEALAAYSIAAVISAIVGQLIVRVWLNRRDAKVSTTTQSLRKTLRDSSSFLISNVTANARQLDIFLVSTFAGAGASGLYAAASRIVQPFYMIPSSLASLIVPHSARLDGAGAKRVAWMVTAAFAGVSILLSPLLFFSADVAVLLLGEAFRDAGITLSVLIVTMPVVALGSPLGSVLQSQGHQRYVAINGALFAILTILSISLAAFYYDAVGAAVALVCSYFLKSLMLLLRIAIKL